MNDFVPHQIEVVQAAWLGKVDIDLCESGVPLADEWLHPEDLLAVGAEIGLAVE